MDAGALDLPDDAFDVAYCQFGLMFVPHPLQALRELRRVLRPGGRLGVVVWSTPDRVPCISILTRHLSAVVPPEPPEQELPSPLALGEPGLLERQTETAGFRSVRAEPRTLDFVFASPDQLWRLRVDEGPMAVRAAVGALAPEARERLRDAVYADLAPYVRQGGPCASPARRSTSPRSSSAWASSIGFSVRRWPTGPGALPWEAFRPASWRCPAWQA